MTILIEALGGDIANPKCSKEGMDYKGNSFNSVRNYTEIFLDHLTTLASCFADIESSCTMKLSNRQMSKVQDCKDSAISLTLDIDKCIQPSKTGVESCKCFAGLKNSNLEKVIKCDISEESDTARKQKATCAKGNIMKCSI